MKVIDAIGSEDTTISRIDLEIGDLPDAMQDEIKDECAQYVKEQVLLSLHDATTPVSGEGWQALSPKYKKAKEAAGATPEANMELYGSMLDSFDYETSDVGFDIGFIGTSEAWKADGHLKFSGAEGSAPRRRFLPGEGQSFKKEIEQGVERIIADYRSTQIDAAAFEDITTSTELYDELGNVLGNDLSDNELKLAALRNKDVYEILSDQDLLDLL